MFYSYLSLLITTGSATCYEGEAVWRIWAVYLLEMTPFVVFSDQSSPATVINGPREQALFGGDNSLFSEM